ncbi:hypothetical protein ACRC7T_14110 [Segnochrobactraceae bacterium EtOH-i3]
MGLGIHETERADLIAALDGAQKALAMLLSAKEPSEVIHVWAACIAAEAVARRVLAQVAEAEDAR